MSSRPKVAFGDQSGEISLGYKEIPRLTPTGVGVRSEWLLKKYV